MPGYCKPPGDRKPSPAAEAATQDAADDRQTMTSLSESIAAYREIVARQRDMIKDHIDIFEHVRMFFALNAPLGKKLNDAIAKAKEALRHA